MFSGLVLTSITTAVMGAALFQRKSRAGWLEELDGIRGEALGSADGELGEVVGDAASIWTDLRDGGVYDDPHEISSLYADDATPDAPAAKPAKAAKPARPRRTRGGLDGEATVPTVAAPVESAPAAPDPVAAPDPSRAPDSIEPAALHHEPTVAGDGAERPSPADDLWGGGVPRATPLATPLESEQIWVEPSPHPVNPTEMWHPAELLPSPLGEETYEPVGEERLDSADLVRSELESELRAAADMTVADAPSAAPEHIPARRVEPPMVPADHRRPSTSGLVAGPVGRRVRRDRPTDRKRTSLPTVEAMQQTPADRSATMPAERAEAPASERSTVPLDRGEQSPLPTAPLPPAALPSRANRLPALDALPTTPSAVTPAEAPVLPAPATESVAGGTEAATAEPSAPAQEVPTPEPAAPEPVETVPVPRALAIDGQGMVDVPGTIVRTSGASDGIEATAVDGATTIALGSGWCWVSPGDGPLRDVTIALPKGRLTVPTAATALAVVEADGSAFVIVADGTVSLQRSDDAVVLERGSIAMLDPTGAAQVDLATDDELQSDPLVAENLSLDAEL